MTLLKTSELSLFADYFQFYLQDEKAAGINGDSWTEEATDRMLAIETGAIGVGTVRNVDVAVIIEQHDVAPDLSEAADQIVECSIEVYSGKLIAAGCTDYLPDAQRIAILPGIYRARITYENLSSVSDDGLDGDDRYRIQIWPAPKENLKIIKRRETGRGGELNEQFG